MSKGEACVNGAPTCTPTKQFFAAAAVVWWCEDLGKTIGRSIFPSAVELPAILLAGWIDQDSRKFM